jgi:cytochrome oxidase Cu insertion factor (SCO1/SenC/PrrC family)
MPRGPMSETSVRDRVAAMDRSQKEAVADYNFTHFRARQLLNDASATVTNKGIMPGHVAPDFTLPLVEGGTVTLSALRGRPVLLHFGSFT